jgi:hypothetical protein
MNAQAAVMSLFSKVRFVSQAALARASGWSRPWCKDSRIRASELTTTDEGDACLLGPLLAQICTKVQCKANLMSPVAVMPKPYVLLVENSLRQRRSVDVNT